MGSQTEPLYPGLDAPILWMQPLLPLVYKRINFVSGSQGSDQPCVAKLTSLVRARDLLDATVFIGPSFCSVTDGYHFLSN